MAKPELPRTGWEWIIYLKEKLEETPRDATIVQANTLNVAKALFQLTLTGSFEGKDLWEAKFQHTIPQATFLKHARVSFGIGGKSATENEKLVYMQILASLLRRGFRLDQLLPSEFFGGEIGTWLEESFNLKEEEDGSKEKLTADHICFKLADQFHKKEGKMKKLRATRAHGHQFILLWCWWVLNNASHISTVYFDLCSLSSIPGRTGCEDLADFVSKAL